MYIKELKLKKIGPFPMANIVFPSPNEDGKFPVTIFTGENGAGKSIVIDAIRTLFMSFWGIERDIIADYDNFSLSMTIEDKVSIDNTERRQDVKLSADQSNLTNHTPGRISVKNGYEKYFKDQTLNSLELSKWVIDYWNSDSAYDDFTIKSFGDINVNTALKGALDKSNPNIDLTKIIVTLDYQKDSEDPAEKAISQFVYNKMKEIINDCVSPAGRFKHVSRHKLQPVFDCYGKDVTLDKINSGNMMLLKNMTKLLFKMYSVCIRNNWSKEQMLNIPGILLIDEIENHLHPNWQKRVLGIIQKHFPKLQIILTTHSPFVITSVKNPIVYACVSCGDHSVINDASGDYFGLPVEEMLNSDPFSVQPFNEKITTLLEERREAVKDGNEDEIKRIEGELLKLNNQYFSIYNRVY